MLDRTDPDRWTDLQERKLMRDHEFLSGKIGEPTFIRSLMIYGYTEREARTELELLKLSR